MEKPEKKQTELDRSIREFLEYCEIEKNRSVRTIIGYSHYLKRFSQFATAKGAHRPEDITLELVRSFRLALNRMEDAVTGKPLKLITQSYHIIALRAFLKYLIKRDIKTLSPEKIELAKNPSRQVSFLEGDELSRILDAIKHTDDEVTRLRDRAILLTLFSSGVRISELVSLRKKMLNLDRGEFTVRGKGDKLRLAFLSSDTVAAIKTYLQKRTDNHPALFISHSQIGQSVEKQMDAMSDSRLQIKDVSNAAAGLTARSVQRLIKKYAMLAGITHDVTPHTFRHSFATDLLRNGADIRSVQSMLGHASITTTQIYTHITNEGLRDIHKKFHNKK